MCEKIFYKDLITPIEASLFAILTHEYKKTAMENHNGLVEFSVFGTKRNILKGDIIMDETMNSYEVLR